MHQARDGKDILVARYFEAVAGIETTKEAGLPGRQRQLSEARL